MGFESICNARRGNLSPVQIRNLKHTGDTSISKIPLYKDDAYPQCEIVSIIIEQQRRHCILVVISTLKRTLMHSFIVRQPNSFPTENLKM